MDNINNYMSLERGMCSFANDTCSPLSKDEYNNAMEFFKAFYNCDLHQFHSITKNAFAKMFGYKCDEETDTETCISEMIPYCKSASRIVKTIRLSMDIVQLLMSTFPKLKVIHLIRDPRGMLISRMRTIPALCIKRNDMGLPARAVCGRYDRDIKIGKSLEAKYPNRLKTVLYEQVVEKPFDTSLQIFKYLGLQPKSTFETWMNEHMANAEDKLKESDKRPDNRVQQFSTYRSNSSATMNAWRSKLRFDDVKNVDKECSHLYQYTGYMAVKSQLHLQNLNISLRRSNAMFP
ncbi:carbohydrate sulfotransferase 1-like [Argopecten irradians]|uniref:carbohydrate sulfotransferase 1-like n=1 Tax=Argopecten irradians TaxID=31199 RepID=UPI00371010EE